jgi:hypothetical protein
VITSLIIARRADRIVRSLKRGARHDQVVTAFARIAVEFGPEVEEAVIRLVHRKLSQESPNRRRRNTRPKGR